MSTPIKVIIVILASVAGTPLFILLGEAFGRACSPIVEGFAGFINGYVDAWKHAWRLVTGGYHKDSGTEGGEPTMKYFYLSLIRGLNGYYVKFEAESEDAVRQYATEYFGRMHGTIYTDAYFHEVIRNRYPSSSRVINNKRPIKLSGDSE